MLTKFMKWLASTALLGWSFASRLPGTLRRGIPCGLTDPDPRRGHCGHIPGRFPTRISLGRCLWCGGLPVQPRCALGVLDSADPGREHARAYSVRTVPEAAENAATAFYRVYYGSHAGQRIVMRQSQREGRFLFTMAERQCPECGGELGLAVRPSRSETANGGATSATSLSTRWRCSTCGRAFTAEQVRQGKRIRLKALESP